MAEQPLTDNAEARTNRLSLITIIILGIVSVCALIGFIVFLVNNRSLASKNEELENESKKLQEDIHDLDKKIQNVKNETEVTKGHLKDIMCHYGMYHKLKLEPGDVMSATQTHTGDYLILHQIKEGSKIQLVKTDVNGNIGWKKVLDYYGTKGEVREFPDYSIIVLLTNKENKARPSVLSKVNPDGTVHGVYNSACFVVGMIESTPGQELLVCKDDPIGITTILLGVTENEKLKTRISSTFTVSETHLPIAKIQDKYIMLGRSKDKGTPFELYVLNGTGQLISKQVAKDWDVPIAVTPKADKTVMITAVWLQNEKYVKPSLGILEYNLTSGLLYNRVGVFGLYEKTMTNPVGDALPLGNGMFGIFVQDSGPVNYVLYDGKESKLPTNYVSIGDNKEFKAFYGGGKGTEVFTGNFTVISQRGDILWNNRMQPEKYGIIGCENDNGCKMGIGDELIKVYPWADTYDMRNC